MSPTLRLRLVWGYQALAPAGAAQGICLYIIRIIRSIRRQLFAVHSFFNASAGFVLAARNVCHNTERKASNRVTTTATTMIQP